MTEARAKLLIRLLAKNKVDSLVAVATFSGAPPQRGIDGRITPGQPAGSDEWNVMMRPGQVLPVTELVVDLHLHGFKVVFGPIEGAPQQSNGQPGESFVFLDILPTMIPEAEEVEEISLDDMHREQTYDQTGAANGWRSTRYGPRSGVDDFVAEAMRSERDRQPQEPQGQEAKVGGEGLWTPGQ